MSRDAVRHVSTHLFITNSHSFRPNYPFSIRKMTGRNITLRPAFYLKYIVSEIKKLPQHKSRQKQTRNNSPIAIL